MQDSGTRGQELDGARPEQFTSGARIDGDLHIEKAGEQPRDVGFDNGHRLIEGERGDGIGGIAANPR